ncbi:fimbria/pilus outer membrane usher protein [Porphyrobacter sp. AAP60]|uniref:fimbria/pilus outer membrane usher protein n=1 Tax=Porphyrobacter sp. AAP60 TaxID=1523423 RepID=UPI001F3EBAB9|nr:fimbria/pilus outer membrane usher protein [Porphyrobacter sp. AAP60]
MINRRLTPDQALVVIWEDALYIRRTDLPQTGLILPELASEFVLSGDEYVSLSPVTGVFASLGEGGSLLDIIASPAAFQSTRFQRSAQPVTLDEIVPAAFISYDLTFSRWNGQNSAFAFLDAGVSNDWGLIGSTAVLQNAGHTAVRLESYFQRDWPNERVRLVIGDTVTKATEWSAPARFAGVRFGTDFALQPTFIAFPVPMLTEAAALPSTVDLISSASRETLAVQPGTFAIDYQPVFSGAGEVTMMITDANGLSRQVTSSFYTSARLLRPGLVDFSVEAGVVRQNYGIESFDYGPPFAAGFLRFGLNDALTLGGRIEVSPDIQTGGLGAGWVLSTIGEFGLAGAVSQSPRGTGTLWRAQFQRIAPTHSFTVSYQRDNGRYAQVANAGFCCGVPFGPPQQELALAGSLSLGSLGDVVVGHAETRTAGGQSFRTTNLSINGGFRSAFYNLGLRRSQFGDRTDNGAFLLVSLPLGTRSSASARFDDRRSVAMVSVAPPNDRGAGYQIAVGHDREFDQPVINASTLVRTAAGELELVGGYDRSGEGIRLSARGALVSTAGKVVATPRLDNAFALVELGSAADVTLYLENRPVVAKGGAGKTALLTGLQPYAQNRIAIDVSSLPITADVDAGEKLVVPGFRQAVRVAFGGAEQSPVTIRLVGPDGVPLAPGLETRVGSQPAGITGYDGLVFLPDLRGGERIAVTGPAFRCQAQIPARPKIDENRQLGPVPCLPHATLEPVP